MASSGEERSCGIIIYRRVSDNSVVEYLPLQASDGSYHWTPPKGHVESEESDKETAFRETREETGLEVHSLQLARDFKVVLEYSVKGAVKKVIYFLAELTDQSCEVKLSEEHKSFQWADLSKGCALVHYQETKAALESAEQFIKKTIDNC